MSPLSKSSYTVSTDELVNMLKNQNVPHDCDLVPFDVTTLFTNVLFEYTIDVILRKDIQKKEMKELTKNVHFEFNGETFQQLDGAAMGSQSSQEFSWLSLKIL